MFFDVEWLMLNAVIPAGPLERRS